VVAAEDESLVVPNANTQVAPQADTDAKEDQKPKAVFGLPLEESVEEIPEVFDTEN